MSGRFFVSVNRKKMKKDLELLKEDHARLSAELIKADLARRQAADTARNTQDVMTAVLSEVQSLQEGIDNLLVLLTIPDLAPGSATYLPRLVSLRLHLQARSSRETRHPQPSEGCPGIYQPRRLKPHRISDTCEEEYTRVRGHDAHLVRTLEFPDFTRPLSRAGGGFKKTKSVH